MHEIILDRNKPLADQAHLGHNRFHPDIQPVISVNQGEEVLIEVLDGFDGQLKPGDTEQALLRMNGGRSHPMSGPVYVNGAEPGDMLEVEYREIIPEPHGVTCIIAGLGLLRDTMKQSFIVHWKLEDGYAVSEQIPGVRVPGAPFMGITAVAPSIDLLEKWRDRERRLAEAGGWAMPPLESGAVPVGACALHGLRTIPPRENGGNMDVKHLTRGSRVMLPVFVDGALFSVGDGHFAQGDGEVCLTAIEMGATVIVRFKVHKGLANSRRFTAPMFSHDSYLGEAQVQLENRFFGVVGYPINEAGEQEDENLLLAGKNALLNMIDLLQERGYSREQAYVLCSVAADLRIGNVVDAPNYVVSAMMPEAIFD